MKPINDATSALIRAVRAAFPESRLVVEEIRSRSWASATFAGARHELSVRIEGDGAANATDLFLANLSAAEFDLRGHVLADVALVSDERRDDSDSVRISLEALTVEDA